MRRRQRSTPTAKKTASTVNLQSPKPSGSDYKFRKFRNELKTQTDLSSTPGIGQIIEKLEEISELNCPSSDNLGFRRVLYENKSIPLTYLPLANISKVGTVKPSTSTKVEGNVLFAEKASTSSKRIATEEYSREEGEILSGDDTVLNVEKTLMNQVNNVAAAATNDDDECILIDDNDDDVIELLDAPNIVGSNRKRQTNLKNNFLSPSSLNSSPGCSTVLNSSNVIVLDETFDATPLSHPAHSHSTRKRRSKEMDNSVVFICETAPDFIPLVSDNVPNPISSPPPSKRRKVSSFDTSLFSSGEKKALQIYNDNAYNPDAPSQKQQREKNSKRIVIIDGSNVAFAHSRNQKFSVKGLQICIEYFEKMGHEVKAVVPQFRLQRDKSTDSPAIEKLYREGKIVLTPSKNLPGKKSTSYDDRFILQLACELDGAIISNDNYRDLITENAAFKKIIENRVIGYTWCDDVFMLPKDPYGKFGPSLQAILNRSKKS